MPSVAGLSSTTRFSSDALILPNDSVMVDFNEVGEETSKSLIVPIAASPVDGGSVWFVLRTFSTNTKVSLWARADYCVGSLKLGGKMRVLLRILPFSMKKKTFFD